jgi:hypothetical protein
MKDLYEEMLRRFPEIRETIELYSDLPYVIMGNLVGWLEDRQPDEIGVNWQGCRFCEVV